MKEKIVESFFSLLPSDYRVKAIAISVGVRIISIILALLTYYYVGQLIPRAIDYSLQITMIGTIVISVITARSLDLKSMP